MRIDLDSVSFRYRGGDPVVSDLSLCLSGPGSVALVGPSGSGKTSLLALLGGLLRPSSGTVRWNGRGRPGRAAWVLQSGNFLGARTVLDNVALGALSAGVTRTQAESDALRLIDAVGLGGLGHRIASTLSGGQAQRMCVARAITARSEFVLADEPTAQLDGRTTASVADVMFDLVAKSALLVVATHDVDVARLADHTIELQ